MFKLDANNKTYPLFTMLIGLVAYLVSGIIVGLLLTILNFDVSGSFFDSFSIPSYDFIIIFIGAAIGGILLLLMFKIFKFNKLIKIVILSILGTLSILVIFIVEIILMYAGIFFVFHISFLVSFLICFMIANAIYGAFIAPVFHGGESIGLFALVCGITSIPFGMLAWETSGIVLIGINLATLVLVTSLGATTGLSIGLYSLLESKF